MSTIRTQIVGVIENVSVHSGDKVKKGHFDSIKNQELFDKQNQFEQIVKQLENKKEC